MGIVVFHAQNRFSTGIMYDDNNIIWLFIEDDTYFTRQPDYPEENNSIYFINNFRYKPNHSTIQYLEYPNDDPYGMWAEQQLINGVSFRSIQSQVTSRHLDSSFFTIDDIIPYERNITHFNVIYFQTKPEVYKRVLIQVGVADTVRYWYIALDDTNIYIGGNLYFDGNFQTTLYVYDSVPHGLLNNTVALISGTKRQVFVNGVLKLTMPTEYILDFTDEVVLFSGFAGEPYPLNGFNGIICETIVYPRAIGESQKQMNENFLMAKWSIL